MVALSELTPRLGNNRTVIAHYKKEAPGGPEAFREAAGTGGPERSTQRG